MCVCACLIERTRAQRQKQGDNIQKNRICTSVRMFVCVNAKKHTYQAP